MLKINQKTLKSVEQSVTSIANNVTKNMLAKLLVQLEIRLKEHLSRNSSAVHKHCQLTGNPVDSSKTKVLATESNTFKRRVREAIETDYVSPL